MSYRKIDEIPKSDKVVWSPERGGRVWQKVGGHKVAKYSYSPFTAKARKEYSFYADVKMKLEIESPPNSGKKIQWITLVAYVGTYLEFRDAVLSGEVDERLMELVRAVGGEEIIEVGYWRNKGSRAS